VLGVILSETRQILRSQFADKGEVEKVLEVVELLIGKFQHDASFPRWI